VAPTLRPDLKGPLGTDDYSADTHGRRKQQRCWSHVLGDLHTLKTDHAAEPTGVPGAQAQAGPALYAEARAGGAGPSVLRARQRTLLARQLNAPHRLSGSLWSTRASGGLPARPWPSACCATRARCVRAGVCPALTLPTTAPSAWCGRL
jgi:hypothetical protein